MKTIFWRDEITKVKYNNKEPKIFVNFTLRHNRERLKIFYYILFENFCDESLVQNVH